MPGVLYPSPAPQTDLAMKTRQPHRETTIFVAIIILLTTLMLIFKHYVPPFL